MNRAAYLVLAGCGRLHFTDLVAGDAAAAHDAPTADAPGPDAFVASPIAHYTMDAITGVAITDVTGHGHDAPCAGACPVAIAGIHAGALDWDGVDDHARIPYATPFDGSGGFTVALWLWLDTAPIVGSVDHSFACPIGKLLGAGDDNSWQICAGPDLKVLFYSVTASTGDQLVAPGPITLAAWHHVAIAWDGTTKGLWLDGVLVATRPTAIDLDGGDIMLGADLDSVGLRNHIDGRLDDVAIYDHALTTLEIAALATP